MQLWFKYHSIDSKDIPDRFKLVHWDGIAIHTYSRERLLEDIRLLDFDTHWFAHELVSDILRAVDIGRKQRENDLRGALKLDKFLKVNNLAFTLQTEA